MMLPLHVALIGFGLLMVCTAVMFAAGIWIGRDMCRHHCQPSTPVADLLTEPPTPARHRRPGPYPMVGHSPHSLTARTAVQPRIKQETPR